MSSRAGGSKRAASLALLAALLAGCAANGAAAAVPEDEHAQHDCKSSRETPIGALPPATPMYCHPLASAPSTFVEGANSWVDDFNHGASMASIGDGYRVFDGIDEVPKSGTFRHNEHWMVDVDPAADGDTVGGAMMRPDRSFRFEDGVLVVEAEVAAGILDYEEPPFFAWPELIVSTSPRPVDVDGASYGYRHFPNAHTIGVRLQPLAVPIEALFHPNGERTWEFAFWLTEGAKAQGGFPDYAPGAWRSCDGTDPDLECRDLFRWELRKDRITLFVNGVKYMEHSRLPADKQLPDEFLEDDVYVYFASWLSDPDHTVRFHWDHIAVNP